MKIDIEALGVGYGGKRVIDELLLGIETGTFFTLLGPSGCGKTTLLRAVAGFIVIDAGHLRFGDSDVTRVPAHKRNIGMVFQDYALFPDKSVFDNVAYGLRARRQGEVDIKRKVGEALESVSLAALANRFPAELSGGQRQRVALVRALVIEPDVLLMDEPLSNLDTKLRHQVRDTIVLLQREAGITTILVTHDQDEALAMSGRIGVMKAGRLEQVGTPAEIYREPRTAYVADFVGAANIIEVEIATPVAANEPVQVSIKGLAVPARSLGPLAAGTAQLVIRPEDTILSRATAGGPAARVERRQFLGGKTSYGVRLEGGPLLRVDCSGDGHDTHAVGDTVAVVFDTAKTLVLAS